MNFRKRALSVLLSAAMICNMGVSPVLAYAATGDTPIGSSSIGASSVCEHHLEHTTECGYTEGTAGAPCTHTHTADCYSAELICGLTEEVVDSGSSSDAAHTHTQDCYKLVCTHVHDTACGYVEAVEGAPCTHECELCKPETPAPKCDCMVKCTLADEENGVEESINVDCPVCAAEGADLNRCVGVVPMPMMAPAPMGATVTEQFTLATGGTYYFDLSGEKSSIGKINTAVPDTTLHYVPFTYAGTVNAYSLHSRSADDNTAMTDSVTADGNTTEPNHAIGYKSDRSLFVADYNVSHTISWNELAGLAKNGSGTIPAENLIFGKTFDTNYKLRSLSVGSSKVNNIGSPATNEWDSIVTKSGSSDNTAGWIKNWRDIFSWGQDTTLSNPMLRAQRGIYSAASWGNFSATSHSANVGWRPALEVLDPATLTSDGLKAVALNLNGGSFDSSGSESDGVVNTINIVCAGDTFTAPSAEGLTRPSGNSGTAFHWKGSDNKTYAVGATVPSSVTALTAQWTEKPLDEQFSLATGQTYYFDLSSEKSNIGTINTEVPDTTLHYVPFTYAGTVNAYSLESSSSGQTGSSVAAKASDRSLFVADYNVSRSKSWDDLNTANLIFGKTFDTNYKLRSLSVGSSNVNNMGSPATNEWDSILGKNGLTEPIKNWSNIYSWGQDTFASDIWSRTLRGFSSAAYWSRIDATYYNGWRPALEVLDPATLISDGLKAVALNLNGGSFDSNGSESDGVVNTINIVCAGYTFTAPSAEGLTRPSGNGGTAFHWKGSDNKTYAVGATVPSSVTALTAQWTKTPQAISYANANISKIYGDAKFTNLLIETTVTGAIAYASDDAAVATVNSTTGEVTIIGYGTDGSATITATAAGTATHAEATASYIVTVAKKALTLQAENKSMTKGGAVPSFTYTATGLTNGDTVTTAPTMATVADGKTTGTFDITISGGTVANDANYSITYTTGTLTVSDAPITTHTITASAGTGGTISPSGSVTVNNGESKTFAITPNSGYSISSVTVDGANQGAISTYTFSNVTDDHIISATFSYNGSGGGDDSSSGGNSGSGSGGSVVIIPSTPTEKDPTPPTKSEIKAPATVDNNGNASITVTDKTVADAIQKAQDEAKKNGVTVELRVDTGKKTPNAISVNLPKVLQDTLVREKVVEFKITSSLADIAFDNKALQAIQKQADGDAQINASKADVSKLSKEARDEIGNRPVFNLSITGKDGKTISDFGGGSATVLIPYTLQPGENPNNLQAYFIDAKGKLHEVTSTYDPVTKCMVFVTNHFSVYGIGYKENAPKFNDIEKHWAKNDIEFVTARGLLSGTGDGKFSPNTAITRGMFVTALGRLAGADVSGYKKSSFADIKTTDYFMGYVEWASKNGIVKGTSATTFAPNVAISRQEMAVIMTNYAKTMHYTLPKTRTAVTFADNANISSWATDAVKSMQMAGVIMGKDGNRFDPTATATRAEASAVLRRYVELIIDKATAQGLDMNDSGKIVYYENGKLFTGTKTIDGTTYHFGNDGICVKIDAVIPDTKKYVIHKIVRGDTLWDIAIKNKCTVAEIVGLNGIKNPNNVPIGTELKIPQK